MYFGYCYWDGDCILYTKQVVDGGPVSPSDLVLSSWEIAALWVVASCGGRGSQVVPRVFLKREDVKSSSSACILEERRRILIM